MPIYNGIEFIDESVSSIIMQTYSDWELLIGINGHSENSEVFKIAKKYEEIDKRIKVFDFYNLKGKSITLNEMVNYAKYDFIALLDVDDKWHCSKLEIQSNFLSNYDVIGTRCVWFGSRPGVIPSIPVGDISGFDFFSVNPIINSSAIIRKNLCYWNSKHDGIEDYDLWLRLRRLGKKFFNVTLILVEHRIHQASAFNAKGNGKKVENLLKEHGFKKKEFKLEF